MNKGLEGFIENESYYKEYCFLYGSFALLIGDKLPIAASCFFCGYNKKKDSQYIYCGGDYGPPAAYFAEFPACDESSGSKYQQK